MVSKMANVFRQGSVFLYLPNIIGYFRVLLSCASFSLAYINVPLMVIFYSVSQVLDATDGWVARKLKQESRLGAVLDQVTDRLSTVFLYVLNCQVYPERTTAILFILIADLAGHWFHTFSAAIAGSGSHKMIQGGRTLLKIYYENRALMCLCIICYEGFWLSTFVLKQVEEDSILKFLANNILLLCIPLAVFKMYTNIHQGIHGLRVLAKMDMKSS